MKKGIPLKAFLFFPKNSSGKVCSIWFTTETIWFPIQKESALYKQFLNTVLVTFQNVCRLAYETSSVLQNALVYHAYQRNLVPRVSHFPAYPGNEVVITAVCVLLLIKLKCQFPKKKSLYVRRN